jgi:hypothetical protein
MMGKHITLDSFAGFGEIKARPDSTLEKESASFMEAIGLMGVRGVDDDVIRTAISQILSRALPDFNKQASDTSDPENSIHAVANFVWEFVSAETKDPSWLIDADFAEFVILHPTLQFYPQSKRIQAFLKTIVRIPAPDLCSLFEIPSGRRAFAFLNDTLSATLLATWTTDQNLKTKAGDCRYLFIDSSLQTSASMPSLDDIFCRILEGHQM